MENGILIVQAILCLAYSAYAKDNALLVRGDIPPIPCRGMVLGTGTDRTLSASIVIQ